MENKKVYYIEVNNWSSEYYPDKEPFISWMSYYELENLPQLKLMDDEWCKGNKICVKWYLLDMSVNFLLTVTKEWVDEWCPFILEDKYKKFLRNKNDIGRASNHTFLEYKQENFGSHEWDWLTNKQYS